MLKIYHDIISHFIVGVARLPTPKRMNSRDKGKRGELELSNKLKEYGYDTKRGQQYCGANGNADVVGLPGVHIECKRVEKLNIYDAISQAVHDCKDKVPAVFHRKNNCECLVTMRLDDFMCLYGKGK